MGDGLKVFEHMNDMNIESQSDRVGRSLKG